jgi:hypothetical protein
VTVSTYSSTHKAPAVYRRNLYLLTFDYVFFALAMAFVDSQTVLADFIGQLSGSEVLVGLIGILFPLGLMLPQLAVAPAVARSENKRIWVLASGIPGRSMMFVIALGILVLGVDDPTPALVLVLVGYGTFAVCDGISAVGWMDLIARVLPNERRGRLYGRGRAIAGLLVLLFVSNMVRDILDPQTGRFRSFLSFSSANAPALTMKRAAGRCWRSRSASTLCICGACCSTTTTTAAIC